MKKKFLLVGLCLTTVISVALSACGNTDEGKKNALSSPNDVYGMGAVSSVRLLGSNIPAGAVKTFSAVRAAAQTTASGNSEREVKEQAERFNEYFTALDSFFGDEIISTSTQKNTEAEYPYDIKMTITGKDFSGETVSYLMYYTETLVGGDEDDEDDEDEEDEEIEKEYQLTGVMVLDGVEYYLEGGRSEETEKDESETELKIPA